MGCERRKKEESHDFGLSNLRMKVSKKKKKRMKVSSMELEVALKRTGLEERKQGFYLDMLDLRCIGGIK